MWRFFWEFWEWSWDMLLDMNLQRYKSGNTVFVGRRVLQDTMGDLLINVIGSFLLSFFSLGIRVDIIAPILKSLGFNF